MGQFITPDVLPPDTFCRRLLIPNDPKWIGIISGALVPLIHPSEWEKLGGITPDEAAERSYQMMKEFWADNGCGGDDMECCEDRVILHQFNPVTGRPEVSYDGGVTWLPDPADPEFAIPLYPPLVTEGGSKTKCDAATNASVHINELIEATGTNLEAASTVFGLAVAVAEAALLLFIVIVTGGAASPLVIGFATAIWAAASGVFNLGIAAYNTYWTVDKQDAILCALFCTIGDNGQWTEAQYNDFKVRVTDALPASPALDIIISSINAGGARGLSQMASYGVAADADCGDCEPCIVECDVELWAITVFSGNDVGTLIGYGSNYVDIQTENVPGFGGALFAQITMPTAADCCTFTGYEVVSGGTVLGTAGLLCDEPLWPTTEVHGFSTPSSINTFRVWSTATTVVRVLFG